MSTIDWASTGRLIGNVASKFIQDGIELDDLKQEATVAVLESFPLYSEDLGVSLNTFLGRRIRDALRGFVSASLGSIEIERKWVAEPINEHANQTIKAETKEECEALRDFHGAERFKKARRVISTSKPTASLDEGWDNSSQEDDSTPHDKLGTSAPQEFGVLIGEAEEALLVVSEAASRAGGHGGADYWRQIGLLRSQGFTFAQIGKALGKSTMAVQMAWRRSQKRLEKNKAA
jgi:RNA polymerase sigma factor (sigma-70 family)